MVDTTLQHIVVIRDCVFGVTDGCGCPPQEGNQRLCSSYRGSHSSASREDLLPLLVGPQIPEEQCGFRPDCGTLDQFFTLVRELEGDWEFAQPVHMCFVDLE